MKQRLVVLALLCLIAALVIYVVPSRWYKKTVEVRVFEEVTSLRISHTGMTYGACWGDFAGDGLPGLYVTNHLQAPSLYRNLGHGRFEDVTSKWFPLLDPTDDKHGCAWADVDNDGHIDLVQLTGAKRGVGDEPKRLFMNRGDHFENVADALGVSNPSARARMPLWVDLDRDGKLDLFQGAEQRFDGKTPPFVFLRRDGKFVPADDTVHLASPNVPFCILTDLANDGAQDLVCRVMGKDRTAQIFSTATVPLRELDLLPVTAFEDVAAGDFDNSGSIDLFLARKEPAPRVALAVPTEKELVADLLIKRDNVGERVGFEFRSSGTVSFRVAPANPTYLAPSASQIHIGANGAHPAALEFTLAPDDPATRGTAAYNPGSGDAMNIGFTPPDKWQVLLSAPRDVFESEKSQYQQVALRISSTQKILDAKSLGGPSKSEEAPFRLFMNRNGKLVDESERRGVNARVVSAVNVVAGDFNNDGYLDLFVVASGDIAKQDNVLLLNRGDGSFDVVKDAGGAAGDTSGVGDSVTTVDFDGDGCLDLFVASGGSMGRSLGIPSERGGYHLYRNLCNNGNHWLEIDLEGTKSNRDGIGARVEVSTGTLKQVRIQDGGIHDRGQNHSRLHFGLGKNARVDKITIRWPSGIVQDLTAVTADRRIKVKEP